MKIEGWAHRHQAVDLTTGQQTEESPLDVLDLVEPLRIHGETGFTRGFGRDRALHHDSDDEQRDLEGRWDASLDEASHRSVALAVIGANRRDIARRKGA